MLDWILALPALAAVLLLLGTLAGAFLPRESIVSRTLQLHKTMDEAWKVILDFPGQVSWRKDLKRVESLPGGERREAWREAFRNGGDWILETSVSKAPTLLRRTLLGKNGNPLGRWDFQLSPTPEGCWITLTERVQVPNPLFRFLGRYVFPRARRVEGYLRDLAAKFGEKPVLE